MFCSMSLVFLNIETVRYRNMIAGLDRSLCDLHISNKYSRYDYLPLQVEIGMVSVERTRTYNNTVNCFKIYTVLTSFHKRNYVASSCSSKENDHLYINSSLQNCIIFLDSLQYMANILNCICTS